MFDENAPKPNTDTILNALLPEVIRPYPTKCSKCKGNVEMHPATAHMMHWCHRCNRNYGDARKLKLHLIAHDNPELAAQMQFNPALGLSKAKEIFKGTNLLVGQAMCACDMNIEPVDRGAKGMVYECFKCKDTFYRRSDLTHHMKKHAKGIKTSLFECPECGHVYRRRIKPDVVDATLHEPFMCFECGSRFSRAEDRLLHQKYEHNFHTWHRCPECNVRLRRVIHREPLTCPDCNGYRN